MAFELAPYGTWQSDVTTELMTSRTVSLGALSVDGEALLWLETRPTENGRSTLMRWTAAEGLAEMTPERDVGTRVHEYGGGAYLARDGVIVFSDRRDGGVWLRTADSIHAIAAVTNCRYADFAWDPTRGRLIAVREDHRDQERSEPVAAIVALQLEPANPQENDGTVLVQGADFYAAPRLAPGYERLCWLEWDHPDMPWDSTRLNVARLTADGLPDRPVLAAGARPEAVLQPIWLDGETVLFASDRTGWWNLYRWREGETTEVTGIEADIGSPAWQFAVSHFHKLPNGRLVAAIVEQGIRYASTISNGVPARLDLGPVAACPVPFGDGLAAILAPVERPPAIVVMPGYDSADLRLVRAAGPTLLAAEDVSVGAAIEFPTADGETAYGFHYAPANSRYRAPDGELPPLVVLIHGGPTSMASNGFALGIQWWTTRGFAVVDVNYRGSTGFGRAYRQKLRGGWGVVDVEDCIAAAQSLAASGRADPARIAIRGGSAGGYTVLSALTASDVFTAGASLYGVADLHLLARDTHKFEARYLDGLIGPLPAAAAIYHERSPINHVDRLVSPIIFFQGGEDRVVPPNQAQAMVAAMTERGLPVAYYEFAGEGHGFRSSDTIHQVLELELDFYARIFGFTRQGFSIGS